MKRVNFPSSRYLPTLLEDVVQQSRFCLENDVPARDMDFVCEEYTYEELTGRLPFNIQYVFEHFILLMSVQYRYLLLQFRHIFFLNICS